MLLRCLCCTLLLLITAPASAALHKCTDASGKIQYSDRPCPETHEAETRSISADDAPPPLHERGASITGIHPSWLDTPPDLHLPVRCLAQECSCADRSFRKPTDPRSRLLLALHRLPDTWNSYLHVAAQPRARVDPRREDPQLEARRGAACDVRIEQEAIVELFPQVVPELSERRAVAEETLQRTDDGCTQPETANAILYRAEWDAYRACQRRHHADQSKAKTTLNHTHFDHRRLLELLPALGNPRPIHPR